MSLLTTETIDDPRIGEPVRNSYADYVVAVNTDVPDMDCIFLDCQDSKRKIWGARNWRNCLTGCASAIASATYHATGKRVRELPARIEKLLRTSHP